MPTISLSRQDKIRVEHEAHRQGLTCKVCNSPRLVSRDTGRKYADGPVRVYLDCYDNEDHDTGASVQSDSPSPPPMHYPGETAPRA